MRVNNRGIAQSLRARLGVSPAAVACWDRLKRERRRRLSMAEVARLLVDNADAIRAEATESKTRVAAPGLRSAMSRADDALSDIQERGGTLDNHTKHLIESTRRALREENERLPPLPAKRGRPGKPVKRRVQERLRALGLSEYACRRLLSAFEAPEEL